VKTGSNLGKSLEKEREADLAKVVDYYRSFKINNALLRNNNLFLVKEAHRLAFAIALLSSKLSTRKKFAKPYFSQLASDSIQVVSAMALGNVRAMKLLERAMIEDVLRYIYYSHHEIEHRLLQVEPNRYETVKALFEYALTHPFFRGDLELKESFSALQSKYSELSREVHASVTSKMIIVKDITSANRPVAHAETELKALKTVAQHMVFALCYFHRDKYAKLSLDEKTVIAQLLNSKQKRELSNLI